IENVFSGNSPLLRAIGNYEAALEAFEHDHTPQAAKNLEAAHAEMDAQDAWDYEQKIRVILSTFRIHHLDQPVGTLSGGQRKRVALAKMLILDPDLLILDEPTNHLDVAMVEWLEEYLSSRNMTLLLVTHDRYFLDRVCNQILELDEGKMYVYNGNFSDFIEKKAMREATEASELDKTRNIYRRELEWVRRMPKARTTKSKSRLDAFDKIADKAKGKGPQESLQLEVKMSRLGGKILEMIKVRKAFGSTIIADGFTYTFNRGERIGIVGKNGVGKSTFLNMIMELEQADSGKIQSGTTIVYGYFSQESMQVADNKRVIDVVKDIAEFIPLADGSQLSAAQLLQRFLFAPETQYTYVSKLSGGEKRRLQLMTVLIRNPNFLILDEPTNDLDIMTLSILEQFLLEFQGCLLLVSHDRYFMDKLVDHLFVFEGDGVITDFTGNYTEYRAMADAREKEQKKVVPPVQEKPAEPEAPRQKKSYKEKREWETLEKELADLEKEKLQLEAALSNPGDDIESITRHSERLAEVNGLIDEKELRWLELSEKE
ncbi:MAG: ABC transporter, partial [Sphingobacteriales bacterium BACL12 MAG-120802-bin5]